MQVKVVKAFRIFDPVYVAKRAKNTEENLEGSLCACASAGMHVH